MPTLEEFDAYLKRLEHHDWYYDYSDDMRAYRAGKAVRDSLVWSSKNQPLMREAFKAYTLCMFEGTVKDWPDRLIKRSQRITELRQQICVDMTNKLLLNAA